MQDVINGVVQYQDLYDVLMQTNLNYVCTSEKDEYIAKGVQVMLNKEELNYLAMLVTIDQRAVVKKFRDNNQLEEANKQKDVREEIIKKLNKMYDELCK